MKIFTYYSTVDGSRSSNFGSKTKGQAMKEIWALENNYGPINYRMFKVQVINGRGENHNLLCEGTYQSA